MPSLMPVIVSALLSENAGNETQVILFASLLSSVVEFEVKLLEKVTSLKMSSVCSVFGVSSRVAPPISSSPVMSVFLIVTVLSFGVSNIVIAFWLELKSEES